MKTEKPEKTAFFDVEDNNTKKKNNKSGVPMLAKEHINMVTDAPIINADIKEVQQVINEHYKGDLTNIPNIDYLLNIGNIETKHGLHLQGIEQTVFAAIYIKAYNENKEEINDIKTTTPYISDIDRTNDYERGIRFKTTITTTNLTEYIYGYKNARLCKDVEKAVMRILNRWVTMPKTNRPNETKWVTFQPISGIWETDTKTKERTIHIEFSKIYTFNLHHSFIFYPENIVPYHRYIASQYISSGFEVNIFTYLYKLIHYIEEGTTNPFRIEKKKLYDAVTDFETEKKSFANHPKRRETRFNALIDKFVKTGFLLVGHHLDTEGKEIEDFGYWETKNKEGQTICNFRLNFDFVETLNDNNILNIIQNGKSKLQIN